MRILYFLENNWVFGKIFNELIKFLHPEIDGDILCWTRLYNPEEAALLQEKFDLYYSTPVGCFFLHDTYGWPLEKCFAQAHSEFDIDDALNRFPREYFDRLAGYATVSGPIRVASEARGIQRQTIVLPVGVTTANYARPTSQSISRLGYFGRMARSDHDKPDLKRGYLAERVAHRTGLEFYHREHMNFLTADRLYRNVDLTMFCSTTEGNPYVALESAAAGVPILGTHVGIFPSLAASDAGVILPTEEDAFVEAAVAFIDALRSKPSLYQYMSAKAVAASRAFDWSVIAPLWSRVFRMVGTEAHSRKDSHVTQSQEETGHRAAACLSDAAAY